MSAVPSGSAYLSVEAVEHKQFATNFIRTAVFELRFPTLYELESPKPPAEFAHALRKEYPVHAIGQRVNMSAGAVATSNAHMFTSRNSRWTVSLTTSTLSLETARYESFVDFDQRIEFLINSCKSFIDSDFFTRVGLRYQNALPYNRASIAEWVNPVLVSGLAGGVFGDATEYAQAIRGATECGGFYFQHGMANEAGKVGYGIDLDFYAENVEVKDSMEVVRALHKREYEMFMWALGEKAKHQLNTAKAGHA
jgi:uncharacterized protein (TIGR04255 family)